MRQIWFTALRHCQRLEPEAFGDDDTHGGLLAGVVEVDGGRLRANELQQVCASHAEPLNRICNLNDVF